jgi:hydrogenase nickel incorporation protein HypA/HybF
MTAQIVEGVLEEAKKQNAKKVTEVHLVIGNLTFLGVEQVRFSYHILIEDTIMKDSKLLIEKKAGVIKCPSCSFKGGIQYEDDFAYHVSIPILRCPKCGKTVKILEGKECTIKSIKMLK